MQSPPARVAPLPPLGGRGLVIPPRDGSRAALALAYGRYLGWSYQRFAAIADLLAEELRPTHALVAAAAARALGKNQKALLGCFASTTVGGPLHCLGLRDALPDFAARIARGGESMVAHLLLELATRRLLDEPIAWPHGAPALSSLALGVTLTPPAGATRLSFASGAVIALGPDGAEVGRFPLDLDRRPESTGGFPVSYDYRRVGRVTRLALVGHNPIAEFEAHPDKEGNHIDLGGRTADEWVAVLDESFAVVESYAPDVFGEMGMLLHEVVPVGFHAERHLSASYREAIGTIYVTLHPNVMTMAEALIHEFQHNKINLAAWSAEFLANAYHPLYKSPVRPDPRPLWGILLAVHAFLPVALLYRRMRAAGHARAATPDFARRMSEIDLKNHEGMEMLRANAQWTPVGRAMFEELDALDRAHMSERAAEGLPTEPTDAHVG